MSNYAWIGVIVVGGVLFVFGLFRLFSKHFEPDQDGIGQEGQQERGPLPSAPLQERAWWALGIATTMTIIIAVFMIRNGITTVFADPGLRVPMTLVLLCGLVAYGLVFKAPGWRGKLELDERDRMIVNRALTLQLVTVFVVLVVWVIGLTEVYWDRGEMPVVMMYVIFDSVFIANLLACSLGILIGYRRL